MSRIVRNDPYLTREDTGADEGQTPAIQHYEKQNGSDGATSNTVFTLSKPYVTGSNTLVIYVNGQKAELLVSATDETEYEETDGNTVTFGASLLDADVVEFMVYGTYFIQDTDNFVVKADQNNSNVLCNGDMRIAQRDTSFVSPSSGYLLDRWVWYGAGGYAHTFTQDTDHPEYATTSQLNKRSLKMDNTTADASVAAADYFLMSYALEGHDFAPLYGDYMTLSFWIKATKTGTNTVSFQNNAVDRTYIVEFDVLASDTWEYKTVTISMTESSGTWLYTTSVGLWINFCFMAGSNNHSTADQWNSDGKFATSNQVNHNDSTSNNIWLTEVKLEAGSVATPFVYRPVAEELALCQRYYEEGIQTQGVATVYNASYIQTPHIAFTTSKRTSACTMTFSNVSWLPAAGGYGTIGAIYSTSRDQNRFSSIYNTTSGTVGHAGKIQFDWVAEDDLG